MFHLNSSWPRRSVATFRAWIGTLGEWPFFALLAVLLLGIFAVSQLPLQYTIDLGYLEGWHSDPPLTQGWNAAEPYGARAGELSYRWSSTDSRIRLPGNGAQPLLLQVQQIPASANPQVDTGALHISGTGMAVSVPLSGQRLLHVLMPPDTTREGQVRFDAPIFSPSEAQGPRNLGAPIAGINLLSAQGLYLPALRLFWPVPLLAMAWMTARRWCLSRTNAAIGGLIVIGLLLATLWADRLRFALAGEPTLFAMLWSLIVAATVLYTVDRAVRHMDSRPSAWFVRSVVLLVFWMMLLRYSGRLFPDSMRGDVGFHVNRQTEVLRGWVHLISRHRGIDFPYPSAIYLLQAPLLLLPVTASALVEWADALFGALGLLPIAYLAWRGLRDERTALFVVLVYALLAPPMMALWWSFLPHIFAQEAVALLIAIMVGMWQRLDTPRGIALMTVALSLIFLGHFGLFINVSMLLAGLLPLLWWRYRGSAERHFVYGLATAFVIAEVLAIGLFYSAYVGLIIEKLSQFEQGGMSAVQGRQVAFSGQALLLSLWRDGLVAHYAIIGVPLAFLGGFWLWQRQRGSILASLFWGTIAVALLQAAIPFLTSSTISTRWLSFCAWVVALGTGIVLDWLWRRGKFGQGLALVTLGWFGSNMLWMWIKALGYRIRPPEPF